MEAFASDPDLDPLQDLSRPELLQALRGLRVEDEIERARHETRTQQTRLKHLHDWFDGFRTLKLIHALRDSGHDNRGWQEALEAAPFVPEREPDLSLNESLARAEDK
jgi:hypothetical protein